MLHIKILFRELYPPEDKLEASQNKMRVFEGKSRFFFPYCVILLKIPFQNSRIKNNYLGFFHVQKTIIWVFFFHVTDFSLK